MTCPISWSRSASVLVSAAVWLRNEPIVAPWPWKALDQLTGQRVDLIRIQRAKQRPEAADQRVEVQRRLGRASGMVSPGLSCLTPPAPSSSARYRPPMRLS